MAELYHTKDGTVNKIHKTDEEIKMRTKSYVEPVKIQKKEGQKVFIIDDEKDLRGQKQAAPAAEVKANPNTGANTNARPSPESMNKTLTQNYLGSELNKSEQRTNGTFTPSTKNFNPDVSNPESQRKGLKFNQNPEILNETSRRQNNTSQSASNTKRPKSILKNSKRKDSQTDEPQNMTQKRKKAT
jgi:hypothetical protein